MQLTRILIPVLLTWDAASLSVNKDMQENTLLWFHMKQKTKGAIYHLPHGMLIHSAWRVPLQ